MSEPKAYSHRTMDDVLLQPLPLTYLFLLFLLIDFPYQYGFRYLAVSESLLYTLIDAALYSALLFITTRLDLARVTLCFLALPYLIFIPGWLNVPTALILMTIFIICLLRTLQTITVLKKDQVTLRDFFTFLLMLVWINISGIGGYGFQWTDYNINNARLHDLVVNAWPIRYGENQNFVYYFGYFLPSAIIGKLSTVDVAMRSVYLWALLGVTLAIRWLSYLSNWRFSISLAIIFILFGPLDILNLLYIKRDVTEFLSVFRNSDMDTLTFSTSQELKFFSIEQQKVFFLGNYPGNSFQLYWSPQQLIAGWLCAALMMHLYLQNQLRHIVFIYALPGLWGPMMMIALFPFIFAITVMQFFSKPLSSNSLLNKQGHHFFSFENIIGAGSLTCVLVFFYLSGSTTTNPSFWLADAVDLRNKGDLIIVFYLAAWGIYSLALLPYISSCDIKTKIWFGTLVCALAILPLRIYGEWSDLLCRSSAALMFILLIFILRALHHYWYHSQKLRASILLCVLIPGTASAFLINKVSLSYYGQTEAVKPLLSYTGTYENFGPDDKLFNHLFRRTLPAEVISSSEKHE